jgi:hypothetical protein
MKKRIKQGLLDHMNIGYSEYEKIKTKPKDYQEISIDDMLYKPSLEFIKTDILGLSFMGINKSPNVYVIKTSDNINSEFLKFKYNNINYTLNKVYVHHKDNNIYLECKYWEEEVID